MRQQIKFKPVEIPEDALREATLNAMAHRDYNEKGANIQIDMSKCLKTTHFSVWNTSSIQKTKLKVFLIFDDRVEISNPGGLIIKESEFGTRSLSRNPVIFSLFDKLELVEHVGSGIGRIKGEMKKAGLKEPVFQFGKFFAVTLFRPTHEELGMMAGEKGELGVKLGVSETRILEQIFENNGVTMKELAEKVGISEVSIYKNIEKLKEKKVLRRMGSDKTGYWEIISREENKKAKDDNKERGKDE